MKMKTKSFIQRYLMRIIAITVTLSMVLNMIPLASLLILTEASAAEPIGSQILVESTAGTTVYEADEAGLLKAIDKAESGSTIDIQGDINITSQIDIKKSLTLKSSNGSSIIRQRTFATDLFMFYLCGSDITVTLKDIIIDGNNIPDQDSAVYIKYTNHLIIENGTIIKNNCSSYKGGGISNDGTLTINGGEISNNIANAVGGGIYNYSSMLTIKGGKISNNTAVRGGGIYNCGTLTMTCGTISGNNAIDIVGGVYCWGNTTTFNISGTATVTDNVSGVTITDGVLSGGVSDNVYLENPIPINVTDDFTGAVGINLGSGSTGTAVTGTDYLTSDSKDQFFIDRIVEKDSNNGDKFYDTVFNSEDTTIDIVEITTDKVTEVSADGGLQKAIDDAADGDYINVTADQTVTSPITISGGKALTIFSTSGSKLLKTNSTANVITSTGANTKLTLRDIIIDGQKEQSIVTGLSAVSNEASAKLILNPGTVIENNITSSTYGASVSNSSYMLMNGGTIRNNTAEYQGGGVYNDGTFTMNNGSISNNTAITGGGVYNASNGNNASIFTMNDGTISNNTATQSGGGVYNADNASTFTMNDGTISNNTAQNGSGGGVHNYNGAFTMEKGNISHNIAPYGSGVYNFGTFTMTKGTISHNTAQYGGGVFNEGNGSTFTMNDGTIRNNTATGNGGGVYNNFNFTMNDGTISNNTAQAGGGVFNNITFTMNNGTISNNTATIDGGGVFNGDTFTIGKGTISHNTATSHGGGVVNFADFIMTDGTISHNTAENAGGVYNDDTFVAVNSSFIGNDNDAIYTYDTVYLFHCTVADNTGTGVFVHDANNKTYIYNGIIIGNSDEAINSDLMSSSENIIDDGGKINRDAIFGDIKAANGFIRVAKGGLADKTADMLTKEDIKETGLDDKSLDDIIEKLKTDQRGADYVRPSSDSVDGKVDFGAIESSVGFITDVVISENPTKTSAEYRYGDELDLSGGSLKVTYNDGRTKTVSMSDPEVKVSGYSPTEIDKEQTVVLKYDVYEFKLYIKVSKYSPLLDLTAKMEGEQSKFVVLTANLTSWYYDEGLEQTIKFYDGTTLLGEAKPDENGKATLNYEIPLFGEFKFTTKLIGNKANDECVSGAVSYKATGKIQTEFELSEKTSELTYGVEVDLEKLVTGGSGNGKVAYKIDGTMVDKKFTPAKTGEITITVTKAEDIDYNEASKTFKVIINKKELTIINTEVKDKVYDGKNTTEFTNPPALVGVIETDNITLTYGTPVFESMNAGNDIEIIFTEKFSISGTNSEKYTLTQPTGITANITNDFAPENGKHYTKTVLNADGGINEDFVIAAKEGYKISTDNKAESDWSDVLTYSEDTSNGTLIFYIKDTATGAISLAKTESYKVDKIIVIVDDLLDEVVSSDDADTIADIIKEYDKLSDKEKEQLPAEAKDKVENAKVSAGKINHTDSDAGITISGDNLSWNIRLASLVKDPSQSDYLDFADKLAGRKLLDLYDIKLTDILTRESYEPQAGETITISLDKVDLKDNQKIQIVHEKKDGSIEYLPATIKDGKITFEATSFSLYGVIMVSDKDADINNDKKPQTGENQDMLSWIGIALAVLALVVIVPCYPVVTKMKNRKKI